MGRYYSQQTWKNINSWIKYSKNSNPFFFKTNRIWMEFPISNNLRISNIRRALSHPGPYTENPMGPRIPVSTALIFSWHGPWWSLVGKVVVALAVVSPSSGGSFSGMCLSRCWLLSQPTIFHKSRKSLGYGPFWKVPFH